jgi:hypothetical protein
MLKQEQFKYVTEEIRQIPVVYLLNLETEMLDELEKKVRDEVRRTSLALKWVQGVKRIKMATKDDNGGRHGK